MKPSKSRLIAFYIFADGLAALLAWALFYYYRKHLAGDLEGGAYFSLFFSGLSISLFWLAIYALWGFYKEIFRKSRISETFNLMGATLTGLFVLFFLLMLDEGQIDRYYRYWKQMRVYLLLHFGVAWLLKIGLLTYIHRLIAQGRLTFPALIIGSGLRAVEVYQETAKSEYSGLEYQGFVSVMNQGPTPMEAHLPKLGHFRDLENLLQGHPQLEQVIIAIEKNEHRTLEKILNSLEGHQLRVAIIPDLFQIIVGSVKVNHVLGTALMELRNSAMPVWQVVVKRGIDILGSLFVMVVFSPLFLVTALMTKLSSPGPVFFSQHRIGRYGKPFRIYKFRSMYVDAEKHGPALSSDYDPRITPWGRVMRKSRLDEIPQFFNVLKGDMSLVGPRPERQYYIDQILLKAPHYKYLHRVRPGITSLGQVKYGYAENVEEMIRRLKFDIIYIKNMSLAMDFRIMIYTVLIVVQGRGK